MSDVSIAPLNFEHNRPDVVEVLKIFFMQNCAQIQCVNESVDSETTAQIDDVLSGNLNTYHNLEDFTNGYSPELPPTPLEKLQAKLQALDAVRQAVEQAADNF